MDVYNARRLTLIASCTGIGASRGVAAETACTQDSSAQAASAAIRDAVRSIVISRLPALGEIQCQHPAERRCIRRIEPEVEYTGGGANAHGRRLLVEHVDRTESDRGVRQRARGVAEGVAGGDVRGGVVVDADEGREAIVGIGIA